MKKNYLIILLILLLMPLKVFASGGFGVSSTSISMYPGDTKTINISSDNAVGKLNISSANTGVATVSTGSVFIQTPGSSQSITITAKSVGTTTVSVVGSSNFATMDEENLSGVTKTITVKVVEKTSGSSGSAKSNNSGTSNTNTNTKSKNNNLKTISVEGYELEKVDNSNYKLTVSNSVTSLTIKATAEDSKAQISGTGAHEIKVGENIIEVVIASESGSKNKINLVITRKDGYYLDDMAELLKDNSKNDINIIIDKDSELSTSILTDLKNNNKLVNFNYYDENKILKYSWIIDGSKVDSSKQINLGITNNTDNSKSILKLTNYASGIFVNFKYDGDLPDGTKVKLFVGENYDNGDVLNLYYYNKDNDKIELVKSNLSVVDSYVEFGLEHCSDYFLTMSNVITNNVVEESNSVNLYMIISIVEFVLLIFGLVYILYKKNKTKKVINNNYI